MFFSSGTNNTLSDNIDVAANIQKLQLSGNEEAQCSATYQQGDQMEKIPQPPNNVPVPRSPGEASLPRSPVDLPRSPADLETELMRSIDSPKSELDALSVALAGIFQKISFHCYKTFVKPY